MSGETSTNPEGQVHSKIPGPALLHKALGSQSFKVGSKHGLFAEKENFYLKKSSLI